MMVVVDRHKKCEVVFHVFWLVDIGFFNQKFLYTKNVILVNTSEKLNEPRFLYTYNISFH